MHLIFYSANPLFFIEACPISLCCLHMIKSIFVCISMQLKLLNLHFIFHTHTPDWKHSILTYPYRLQSKLQQTTFWNIFFIENKACISWDLSAWQFTWNFNLFFYRKKQTKTTKHSIACYNFAWHLKGLLCYTEIKQQRKRQPTRILTKLL